EERDPAAMIADGMLEKIEDFEHNGVSIPASRLGYRITRRFVRTYMGRVFDNPVKVFTEDILQPEKQDFESYADGILYIAEAQKRVAKRYLEDSGYDLACPPLRAIISILANGEYEGKGIDDPSIREMFTREHLLASDWYRRRLVEQQDRDIQHWRDCVGRLKNYLATPGYSAIASEMSLEQRLAYAEEKLSAAEKSDYVDTLVGTLGADPMRVATNDPMLADRLASV
ncbi:MAG: hypothetical protein AAFX06_08795, partial [Planctomycetota bacterium]